jgi:hypothetical protein
MGFSIRKIRNTLIPGLISRVTRLTDFPDCNFVDYLIKNPSELDKIPNGCTIIFEETQGNINEVKLKNANVLNVRKVYEFG